MKALTARPASMSVEQYDYLIPFTNPRARLYPHREKLIDLCFKMPQSVETTA